MKLIDKTVLELKEIAKKNGLNGYSKLNKENLIKFLKKGGEINNNSIYIYDKNNEKHDIKNDIDAILSVEIFLDIILTLIEYRRVYNLKYFRRREYNQKASMNRYLENNFKKQLCKAKYPYKLYPSQNYTNCTSKYVYEELCTLSDYVKKPECKLYIINKEMRNINKNIEKLKDILYENISIIDNMDIEYKKKFYDNIKKNINDRKIYFDNENDNIKNKLIKKNNNSIKIIGHL